MIKELSKYYKRILRIIGIFHTRDFLLNYFYFKNMFSLKKINLFNNYKKKINQPTTKIKGL